MKYTFITDEQAVSDFREKHVRFTIYKNKMQTQSSVTCKLGQLQQYIVEPVQRGQSKHSRKFILFNPSYLKGDNVKNVGNLISGKKKKDYCYLPNTVMMDLDFKTSKQKNKLTKDLNCTTFSQAYQKTINDLKNDPCLIYLDRSSKNGIKGLFNVSSAFYEEHRDEVISNMEVGKYTEMVDDLNRKNMNIVFKYLEQYGIKLANDKKVDYIDTYGYRVTQCTYSSNGNNAEHDPNFREYGYENFNILKFNPNAHIIFDETVYLDFQPKTTKSKISKSTTTGTTSNVVNSAINQLLQAQNDEWSSHFFKYLKQIKVENKIYQSVQNDLTNFCNNNMTHYDSNLSLLFSLFFLSKKYLKKFWKFYRKFYKGNSISTKTFNDFYDYIHRSNPEFGTPLKRIFQELSDKIGFNDNGKKLFPYNPEIEDIFKNQYNQSIEYGHGSGYISEVKIELEQIFNSNNFVVLKCEAGSGKSHFMRHYLMNLIVTNQIKKAVVVIPKNSLLLQQYELMKVDLITFGYNNIKIHKCFDSLNYDGTDGIVFCSTPNIRTVGKADIIVIDEIQNLVSYSDTIYSDFDRNKFDKIILYSATPEKYLIFETGYYYVNLFNKNTIKKSITNYVSNNRKAMMKLLHNNNREQFVFWNDTDIPRSFFTPENFDGVEYIAINSTTKDEPAVKKILHEQQMGNVTHAVATSYVADGVNFEDLTRNDIIIVEANGVLYDEKYQISNRFRKVKDINVKFISNFRSSDYKGVIDITKFNNINKFNKDCKYFRKIENRLNQGDNRTLNEYANSRLFNKISGQYFFNPDSLKKEIYDELITENYKRYNNVQDELDAYYFDVTKKYQYIDKPPTFEKGDTKLKEFINNNLEDVMEVVDLILKDEWDMCFTNTLGSLTPVDIGYIYSNMSVLKTVLSKYTQLISLSLPPSKCTLDNSSFTKLINRTKNEKLWNESDEGANMTEFYREKRLKLQQIIDKLKVQDKKGDYYFTTKIVLDYFNKNENDYNIFRKIEGEHIFKLNETSIGKYLKLFSEKWKKKRKNDGFLFKILPRVR